MVFLDAFHEYHEASLLLAPLAVLSCPEIIQQNYRFSHGASSIPMDEVRALLTLLLV